MTRDDNGNIRLSKRDIGLVLTLAGIILGFVVSTKVDLAKQGVKIDGMDERLDRIEVRLDK